MHHRVVSLFGHVHGMFMPSWPIRSLSHYNVHKILLNYNMTRFGRADLFDHLFHKTVLNYTKWAITESQEMLCLVTWFIVELVLWYSWIIRNSELATVPFVAGSMIWIIQEILYISHLKKEYSLAIMTRQNYVVPLFIIINCSCS